MSLIRYNDITLPYALTTVYSQEPVMEESDTDWYLIKYDLTVQFQVGPNTASVLSSEADSAFGPDKLMAWVRSKLSTPRKKLEVIVNGYNMIPSTIPNFTGTVDAKNGPHPKPLTVMQLNNENFLCTWQVQAHYWENHRGQSGSTTPINRVGPKVLYNRWTETQQIDECDMSSYTREGKIAIRSDGTAITADDDNIRIPMAILGVRDGFIRESRQYSVSKDGLELSYRVTDKEQFKMPPAPAFKAEGTFRETYGAGLGKRTGECYVRLTGGKYDINRTPGVNPQVKLVERAIAIAWQKIQGVVGFRTETVFVGGGPVGPTSPGGVPWYFFWVPPSLRVPSQVGTSRRGTPTTVTQPIPWTPMGGEIRVDMYKNEVEVTLKCMFPASRNRFQALEGVHPSLCVTPFTDGLTADLLRPRYTGRGSSSILLQAAAYYDASIGSAGINVNNNQMLPGEGVAVVPGEGGRNP